MTLMEDLYRDYQVYGTHTETDAYRSETTVIDSEPRCTIRTMWHPVTDAASVAAYGAAVSSMRYAILYTDPGVQYGDIIAIDGADYTVTGLEPYNTHTRVVVTRRDP